MKAATSLLRDEDDFAHQLWQSGMVRLNYVRAGEEESRDWEEFQAHRKCLAVIGLLDCGSCCDLPQGTLGASKLFEEMMAKEYPTAAVSRCFAFDPKEDQEDLDRDAARQITMIPNVPSRQIALMYLNELMLDFAYSILKSLRLWTYSPGLLEKRVGAYVATPLDSLDAGEVTRLKRRRDARLMKTRGDFALLACAPVEAVSFYAAGLEATRSNSDAAWSAGCLEGLAAGVACCARCGIHPTYSFDSAELLVNVADKYDEAIALYAKSRAAALELDARLKLARFLASRGAAHKPQAVELLQRAYQLGAEQLSTQPNIVLVSAIALLFKSLGYERKYAFFMRQVAMLYRDLFRHVVSHRLLRSVASHYRVPLGGGGGGQSGSGWMALQRCVLDDLVRIAQSAGDNEAAARYLLAMLGALHEALDVGAQRQLIADLLALTSDRPPLMLDACALPIDADETRCVALPMAADDAPVPLRTKAVKKGLFIYSPFAGKKKVNIEVRWVAGERGTVRVRLHNPLDVAVSALVNAELDIDAEAIPMPVTLPPRGEPVDVSMAVRPLVAEPCRLLGCRVRMFNVASTIRFATPIGPIPVVASLPRLSARQVLPRSVAATLYAGQRERFSVSLDAIGSPPGFLDFACVLASSSSSSLPAAASSDGEQADGSATEADDSSIDHLLPPVLCVERVGERRIDVLVSARRADIEGAVEVHYAHDAGAEFKRCHRVAVARRVLPALSVARFVVQADLSADDCSTALLVVDVLNRTREQFALGASFEGAADDVRTRVDCGPSVTRVVMRVPRFELSEAEITRIIGERPSKQYVRPAVEPTEAQLLEQRLCYCYRAAIVERLRLHWLLERLQARGSVVGMHAVAVDGRALQLLRPQPVCLMRETPASDGATLPRGRPQLFTVRVTNCSDAPVSLLVAIEPQLLSGGSALSLSADASSSSSSKRASSNALSSSSSLFATEPMISVERYEPAPLPHRRSTIVLGARTSRSRAPLGGAAALPPIDAQLSGVLNWIGSRQRVFDEPLQPGDSVTHSLYVSFVAAGTFAVSMWAQDIESKRIYQLPPGSIRV
jgi:Transport protein Trs120 or TRAPPC9, TRAPP II complex subunit